MQRLRWSPHSLQASAASARLPWLAPQRISRASVAMMVVRIDMSPVVERSPPGEASAETHSLALRARRLVERRAQALRKLDRVVVGPEVHEDQARLLGQHVTVDRG